MDRSEAFGIDDVAGLADTITKATLAAAAAIAVLVVLIGLAHAVRDRLRRQLVINDTAPPPAAIAGADAGSLSPWVRQRVHDALTAEKRTASRIVDEVFRRDVRLGRLPSDIAVIEETALITNAAKDTMSTVAKGLRAVAPGQADGILGALGSALPRARGCQVHTVPLLRGPADEPRLGLAIELLDLDGTPIAATTLWEPPSFDPSPPGVPAQSWQERLVTLIEPAARWIALRLVATQLRTTPARSLSDRGGWRGIGAPRPRQQGFLTRRRTRATRLGLQRLLAAALTLTAIRPYPEHALAFGAEALDDLDEIGTSLTGYHRPSAIRAAVLEEIGFAYRAEKDEQSAAKARRSFLAAAGSWLEAEQLVARNPGARAASAPDAELPEERERYRIRHLKCSLLSGDRAAIAAAADELNAERMTDSTEMRTLYSVACLYVAAVEALGAQYIPLAWEFLGRALLAATKEGEWEHARIDRELACLADRQRFLDDLRRLWDARHRDNLPPLRVAEARRAVLEILDGIAASPAPSGMPAPQVPPPREPVSAAGDPPPAEHAAPS